jgi:hypothetical protein
VVRLTQQIAWLTFFKTSAPFSEFIDVGRLDYLITITANRAGGLIIGEEKNNVWSLCCFRFSQGE